MSPSNITQFFMCRICSSKRNSALSRAPYMYTYALCNRQLGPRGRMQANRLLGKRLGGHRPPPCVYTQVADLGALFYRKEHSSEQADQRVDICFRSIAQRCWLLPCQSATIYVIDLGALHPHFSQFYLLQCDSQSGRGCVSGLVLGLEWALYLSGTV